MVNSYIAEYFGNKKKMEKDGVILEGYDIKGDGTIELTNYKTFERLGKTDEDIEQFYKECKDCYAFAKAVEKFNVIYNDDLIADRQQNTAQYNANYKYDIMLVFTDTSLLYLKLSENQEMIKNKKVKLLTSRIEPKTQYLEMVQLVELAFKNYKYLDRITQLQVLALVMQTISDAKMF